jgi:hypothetical protein
MVYRERYREPTLELVVPTMLVSNVFLVAFYERFGFQLLGVVLAFVPLISVSETLAFSLGLRNLIFVTGEHLYDGSMISFLTYPLRRETLFFFIYISDVVLPLLMWVFTTLTYSMLSGVEVPSLLYLTFVAVTSSLRTWCSSSSYCSGALVFPPYCPSSSSGGSSCLEEP